MGKTPGLVRPLCGSVSGPDNITCPRACQTRPRTPVADAAAPSSALSRILLVPPHPLHQGRALSSNDALYADMSSCLTAVIGQFSSEQEVSSVDESLLRFTGG